MLIKANKGGGRVGDAIEDVLQRSESGNLTSADLLEQLLAGSLFVLQHPEANLSDADIVAGRISLGVRQIDGRNVVAVFSSQIAVERLAPSGSTYVGVPASALLGMWGRDDWLLLNPTGRYQLIVSPVEVAAIVRGDDIHVEVAQ